MEIVAFEPEMAAGVARCYNELVAPVPLHRDVEGEKFAQPIPCQFQDCTSEQILVARAAREVVGFVHVGVSAKATHEWHVKDEPGVIRFLSYRLGERLVGAALLDAAEKWLREHGRSEVVAESGLYIYRFYPLGLAHISERIGHVPPLFGMAGYTAPQCEVFFAWHDFAPPETGPPAVEVQLRSEETPTESGLKVSVVAMQEDQQVGEFSMVSLCEDLWRPQLADWCTAGLLRVADRVQGRGIGKCLLARGLAEMRARGARHAMISTDWDNWRAYLFYTNFGFTFLDRTFGFSKSLASSGD
jgi:GNAT superfamily N-acetyltransferase